MNNIVNYLSSAYEKAGVSIDLGNGIVNFIKESEKKRGIPSFIHSEIGGFNAVSSIPKTFKDPLLITSTDGIGTKIAIGVEMNSLESLGQDLIAMVVNDIVCSGAKPCFFLDTISFSNLEERNLKTLLSGIQRACELADCYLIGGETAEMPGFFQNNYFDVVGFGIGIVEKSKLLQPSLEVKEGDIILGISSSGIHSNGFSLVRNIIKEKGLDLNSKPFSFSEKSLGEILLTPTTIYSNLISYLLFEADHGNLRFKIHGISHITGGGIIENIPRAIPSNLYASIDYNSWEIPEIFSFLQKEGNVSREEMLRVFNMGIGLVLIVDPFYKEKIKEYIYNFSSYEVKEIGYIEQ